MVELITDRTQYHVSLLNRLRKKPWSSMTASEQDAWFIDAMKGAYNYTDLNRVETAVSELAVELGLDLVTKTNWTAADIPVASEMERYLGNIVAIRDACPGDVEFPTLPVSMNRLTFEGANSIEKVLTLVYEELLGVSDYDYLWIEKKEGTQVYVGVLNEEGNYFDISNTAEERLYDGRLWYVYKINDYFRFSVEALPGFSVGEINTTGLVYDEEFDDFVIDSLNAYVYVEVTSGGSVNPDIPGGSEDADYIRSGEIYSGEVL